MYLQLELSCFYRCLSVAKDLLPLFPFIRYFPRPLFFRSQSISVAEELSRGVVRGRAEGPWDSPCC